MYLRWRGFLLELAWTLINQFLLQNWVRNLAFLCSHQLNLWSARWLYWERISDESSTDSLLSQPAVRLYWVKREQIFFGNYEFRKSEFVPIPILTNSSRLRIGIQSCCQHCSEGCSDITIDHIWIFSFLALVRNPPSFLIIGTNICVS